MKVRMRFIKRGPIQYIGHLDLMRFFQKVFRRCGLDVAYSNGYNPHQILSFASPLGVGLTSIGEYLDASINSLNVVNAPGLSLTTDEWIDRINEYSNDMVIVTAFNIMPDDIKPSMSLLSAASYVMSFIDDTMPGRLSQYYNNNNDIMYTRVSKKSTTEINLKDGIYIAVDSCGQFHEKISAIADYDTTYESKYMSIMYCNNPLYIMCASGSSLNIKPEMLAESYMESEGITGVEYDIIRLDMFVEDDGRYISMSK